MIHPDPRPGQDSQAPAPEPRAGGEAPAASRLSVVIVLYNSADVIADCLATVASGAEVIVIDNASTDDGAELARAARPDARVIRSPRNLGFGAGCNLGWKVATRPYVAFVNPDVRLRADALELLLRRLGGEKHSVVGPALLDRSGAARPCKRRPSALLDFCGLLPAAVRWGPAGIDGKLDRAAPVHRDGGAVASVEGACFLISTADLEAINGFDEDLFLYYEEESIALRLARLGGGAIYEPGAVAEHVGEASTSQVAELATRHLHRSRIIFYRKRDGVLRGELTALVLIVGVLLSAPSAAANSVLRRAGHTMLGQRWHVLAGLLAGMTAALRSDLSY
jgi:N-acetylglucosaminyl-diphospho-decaprenol L-rhamnosyltransferase